MRWDKNSVRNGMFAMGTQGERIGKVIRCDADTFVVEKGIFFPKDYELRYDHITDIAGGTIRYALTDFLRGQDTEARAEEETEEKAEEAAAPPAAETSRRTASAATATAAGAAELGTGGPSALDQATARPATPGSRQWADPAKEEIRIPLMREEIGIEKVAHESGRVRIHKTVHTEEKRFSVPVTREEIVIEHVAVGRDAPSRPGDPTFQEDTVGVPLYEEEVRVSKRPYLEEEVVVRTVARSVEREGSATLRHEEAEVEDTRKTASAKRGDGAGDDDPDTRR